MKITTVYSMILLLLFLFMPVWAQECEIVIPELPQIDIATIKPQAEKRLVDVIFELNNGDTIVRPGFLADDKESLLTSYVEPAEIKNMYAHTYRNDVIKPGKVIHTDILCQQVLYKIEEQKLDNNPSGYFVDQIGKNEPLAILYGSIDNMDKMIITKAAAVNPDPFYRYAIVLPDDLSEDFSGAFALDYRGQLVGIIKSFSTDQGFKNYVVPPFLSLETSKGNDVHSIMADDIKLLYSADSSMFSSVLQDIWQNNMNDAALKLFKLSTKTDKQTTLLVYQAFVDYKLGKLFSAMGKAQDANKFGKKTIQAYMMVTDLKNLFGNLSQSAYFLDSALQIDKKSPEVLLSLVSTFYNSRKWFNIESVLDDLPDSYKNSGYVKSLKGLVRAQDEDYDEACKLFNAALEKNPRDLRIYYMISQMFDLKREYDLGRKYLDYALRMDTTIAESYEKLGEHFSEMELPDSALAALKKAVEYNPYLYDAQYDLGVLLEEKEDYENALIHLEMVLDIKETDVKFLRKLANCLLHAEQYQKAVDILRKALVKRKKNPESYYLLGQVYVKLKKYKLALDVYNIAYDLGYRDRDLFYKLGELYWKTNDTAAALEKLETLKLVSPLHANKLNQLINGVDIVSIDSSALSKLDNYIAQIDSTFLDVTGFSEGYGIFFASGGGFLFSPFSEFSVKSWAMMLNQNGDILLDIYDLGYIDYAYVSSQYWSSKKWHRHFSDLRSKKIKLNKTKTDLIGEDYVIFKTDLPDTTITSAPQAPLPPEVGDTIIIYMNPMNTYSEYFYATISAINFDPLRGDVLSLKTPFELAGAQGLLLDRNGNLTGFLSSVSIPGYKISFATPLSSLYYYLTDESCDIRSLSEKVWEKNKKENDRVKAEKEVEDSTATEEETVPEQKSKEDIARDNFVIGQVYIWLGNHKSALEHLRTAYEAESGNNEYRIYYDYCLTKTGSTEAAIDDLEDLTKKRESYAPGHFVLGLIYKSQFDNESAIKSFKRAVFYNAENLAYRFELARLYILTGHSEDATKEYEKIKEKDPALAQKLLE